MKARRAIGITAGVLVLGTLGGVACAFPALPIQVALSSDRAGVSPVVVRVRLRYEMQCGWPGPGPLTIRFPAAMSLPRAVPPAAILINGRPTRRATPTSRHRVVLALPPRPQILCDVIAPGVLGITLTRAARVANPKSRGIYTLRVDKGTLRFSARLAIHG